MPNTDKDDPSPDTEVDRRRGWDAERLKQWMSSDITITLPGWAIAAAGLVFLVLLIGALD